MSFNGNKTLGKSGKKSDPVVWSDLKSFSFSIPHERGLLMGAGCVCLLAAILAITISTSAALITLLTGFTVLLLWTTSVLREATYRAAREKFITHQHFENVKSAVEQSPMGVMVCDTEWNIQFANNNFADLLGLKAKQLIGHNAKTANHDWLSQDQIIDIESRMSKGLEW